MTGAILYASRIPGKYMKILKKIYIKIYKPKDL